jgi:prolyl 4-hydroxylase
MAADAPPDAIAEIRRLAAAGDPGSVAYTAVMAALGTAEPQSWSAAMERLGRAAELGAKVAQGQLRVLSGQGDGGEGRWAQIAAAVDLGPWLAPADLQPLAPGAPVAEAPGFLSPAVCAWIIERVRGGLARAQVYDAADGTTIERPERSNSAFVFWMAQLDVVILLVRAKIAATVGAAVGTLEQSQILHYAPGQEFSPHYDFIDPQTPGHAVELARGGQRVATFLVYLNDAYEGGMTAFPVLGFGYRGETGAGLMFRNLDPAGQPDRRMLHAGQPPTSGEKWLLSQWIRDRDGQAPYAG